jgi:hypothetical protein
MTTEMAISLIWRLFVTPTPMGANPHYAAMALDDIKPPPVAIWLARTPSCWVVHGRDVAASHRRARCLGREIPVADHLAEGAASATGADLPRAHIASELRRPAEPQRLPLDLRRPDVRHRRKSSEFYQIPNARSESLRPIRTAASRRLRLRGREVGKFDVAA